MYHHVNPNKGDMITVTPEVFEGHLRHIRDAGFKTLSSDELVAFIEGKASFKEKCVALTFDDGYLDNYLFAFPLLKAYGVRAIIFIVTDWVEAASRVDAAETKAAMDEFYKDPPTHAGCSRLIEDGLFHKAAVSWEMAEEMERSGLVEILSHTATHRSCDTLPEDELAEELKASKAAIDKRLSKDSKYLCWPRGRFNDTSVEAASKLGFRGIYTTVPGVVKMGDDPLRIKRIVVKDGPGWLKKRLRIYTSPLLADLYLKVKG
jgi:peptidoglycan/xylan/chitin deacetylase (PgdA/CDA1 family)